MTTNEDRERLLGAWTLVSWEAFSPEGKASRPLGADALGQLIYDASGCMSVQLARANRRPFADEDWLKASRDEIASAWPDYFAYFGTFTLDPVAGTVTHHVRSGSFPNLVNTDQIRNYGFGPENGRLTLDAASVWGSVRIVWDRVR